MWDNKIFNVNGQGDKNAERRIKSRFFSYMHHSSSCALVW